MTTEQKTKPTKKPKVTKLTEKARAIKKEKLEKELEKQPKVPRLSKAYKMLHNIPESVPQEDSDLSVNIEDDLDILAGCDYHWSDINDLSQNLAINIQEFIARVNGVVTSPEIIEGVKNSENSAEAMVQFAKLIDIFFADMEEFSARFAKVKELYVGKTGVIETMEDYDLYNSVAIEYNNMYNDLTALVGPDVSAITVFINDTCKLGKLSDTLGIDESSLVEEEPVNATEDEVATPVDEEDNNV